MRVEFVNPFVRAAREVLESELGGPATRGDVRLEKGTATTDQVTAVVGVTGQVTGMVLYSMSEETARRIVSTMLGEECSEFDALAQSGIGELGNVITGRAGVLLAEAGYPSDITPPALMVGTGSRVATAALPRLVVPLESAAGRLEIHVVLKEAAAPLATTRAA